MKVVGLTGGMGSGKTTVAGFFKELGVPVYIADNAAKSLMENSPAVRKAIIALLGDKAYEGEKLNRKYIALKVFNSEEELKKLNSIVHPAVAEDFRKWKQKQNFIYVIYEAAILFESGGHKNCDKVVLVTAPYDLRMKRLKQRDQSSEEEIEARMQHQWSDEKKRNLSDFEIINIDLTTTQQQVKSLHEFMLKCGEI